MDKVCLDINVIRGILSAYHRCDKNQTRIYGIILGTKQNNIYHITDSIYGFIFEGEDDKKTNKKVLMKLNDESLSSIFNSLRQKFKMNNDNIGLNKNKETETTFQNNDTLMILGGFVTDKEPFSELFRFHSTLDKINNEIFPNINKILLLIDPSHKDELNVKYGIKAYEWDNKNIKFKNLEKSNNFIVFKEIEYEVVQQINNLGIINRIKNQNIWEKLYDLKEDKNEKKNINELLFDLKDVDEGIITTENNIDFIKKKLQESISYMNIFEKYLESEEEINKDKINGDYYNVIAFIISQLDPILNDKEILDSINKDINKKYNIDSLTQLIEVQMALSDKIRELIK